MSHQDTEQQFDMITALLGAGVPHIVEQILQSLDAKSLVMSDQVSSIWRDTIENLRIWKHMIKHKINSNQLWRGLFKRREWNKYLDMPPAEQISRQFYRQLHHSACRDIHSLEANWRRGHHTLTRLKTGSSEIYCLQYDDNKIVTGHSNSTIKIWDKSTLQLLKVLEGHKSVVRCLQFDRKVVISGSYDYTVKVWDIQTGQMIYDLLHHDYQVTALKFTVDTLVTGSADQTVAVWNFKSPTDITLRMTFEEHEHRVVAVDLSEAIIIAGYWDKTIMVWDAFTGELVRTLQVHPESEWLQCLQLQGSHLFSCSTKQISIWNFDTGECMRELHGHGLYFHYIAVDSKKIVSGSYKTMKVWDLAAALDAGSSSDTFCITTLEAHYQVTGVQFDDFQVIGCSDGTLFIYNFLDPMPPF